MGRKKRPKPEGNAWLNTYADMVTLLLTFFAVLLSMSTVNQEKFNTFIRSFSNLPPEVVEEIVGTGVGEDGEDLQQVDEETVMEELYQALTEYVAEGGGQDSITLFMEEDIIYIRFDSAVFFEPDRYVLRRDSYPMLELIGNALKEYEDAIRLIKIGGHTAITNRPNSNISDWMLSSERAAVVAMYLEEQRKFDPQKLVVVGYGKNHQISNNQTEDGRRANRRVELAVIGIDSPEGVDALSLNGGTGE